MKLKAKKAVLININAALFDLLSDGVRRLSSEVGTQMEALGYVKSTAESTLHKMVHEGFVTSGYSNLESYKRYTLKDKAERPLDTPLYKTINRRTNAQIVADMKAEKMAKRAERRLRLLTKNSPKLVPVLKLITPVTIKESSKKVIDITEKVSVLVRESDSDKNHEPYFVIRGYRIEVKDVPDLYNDLKKFMGD
jgi:hypothetical protein